jgi:Rod binding domain-containing protein
MDISPLQSHVKASTVPFDQLAANPNVSQSDKVKEACRQFEAILLRQILGEARKTVITSSANGDSNETGIYNDMINNQMADSISRGGAFGLAKSLENQLVRQVLPKGAKPGQSSAATTPAANQPIIKP